MRYDITTPEELENELKKKIIGQDSYLRDLSLCLWLHNQRREHYLRTGEWIRYPKYNMLVLGKSGMGKTSAIQAAASLLDIPFVIEDASELRGAGWKGKPVSEIVKDIEEAAVTDVGPREDVEFTIVVLDEIDKVFEKRTHDQSFSPTSNLLKFIEGEECVYGEGANRMKLSTDNLLFIGLGAFDGIDGIIEKRVSPKSIGFCMDAPGAVNKKALLSQVTNEDLISYGVSGQLLGRFPFLSVMNELEECDYEKILLSSELSPVRQLDTLMSGEHGVSVTISNAAAKMLAKQAKKLGLGARSLQNLVLSLFKDSLYNLAKDSLCSGIRLDYNGEFTVDKLQGKRKTLEKQKPFSYHMEVSEREKLKMIKIDNVKEDMNSVRVYAEQVFEPFETANFRDYPPGGLVDCYDYMTIRQAVFFTAAAIMQLFREVKITGKTLNMSALLGTISRMSVPSIPPAMHWLEEYRDELLEKLKDCSTERIKELRRLSWSVVYKHALLMYEIDYGQMNEGEK